MYPFVALDRVRNKTRRGGTHYEYRYYHDKYDSQPKKEIACSTNTDIIGGVTTNIVRANRGNKWLRCVCDFEGTKQIPFVWNPKQSENLPEDYPLHKLPRFELSKWLIFNTLPSQVKSYLEKSRLPSNEFTCLWYYPFGFCSSWRNGGFSSGKLKPELQMLHFIIGAFHLQVTRVYSEYFDLHNALLPAPAWIKILIEDPDLFVQLEKLAWSYTNAWLNNTLQKQNARGHKALKSTATELCVENFELAPPSWENFPESASATRDNSDTPLSMLSDILSDLNQVNPSDLIDVFNTPPPPLSQEGASLPAVPQRESRNEYTFTGALSEREHIHHPSSSNNHSQEQGDRNIIDCTSNAPSPVRADAPILEDRIAASAASLAVSQRSSGREQGFCSVLHQVISSSRTPGAGAFVVAPPLPPPPPVGYELQQQHHHQHLDTLSHVLAPRATIPMHHVHHVPVYYNTGYDGLQTPSPQINYMLAPAPAEAQTPLYFTVQPSLVTLPNPRHTLGELSMINQGPVQQRYYRLHQEQQQQHDEHSQPSRR